jgi:glycosyltransferase involved in cell wall biosynthesis
MPKISVIIPNYNHAQFLEQRIESILNQTFQDFEIIFLDDNSTDNSWEVFSKYATHPKISHAVVNETNSGSPFKQWNKGFSLATGEYIWIAESDDYAESTILAKLAQKLDAHPAVGLVYSQSWQVDENGSVISTMDSWTDDLDLYKWKNDYIEYGINECANYLSVKNVIPNASAVMFRRCFMAELRSDMENFKLCGDWLFWIEILLKSDVAFIAEPLNFFRCHKNTARSLTKLKTAILEQINILDYLSRSVKIPDITFCKIKSDMINSYFSSYYSEPIDYKDLIKFYGKLLALNYKFSHYIGVSIEIFNKVFELLRVKLTFRTRIKNLLKLSIFC